MSVTSEAFEKDFYSLLGLTKSASQDDIKRAYRDMSRIYHPDSNYYSDIVDDSLDPKHDDLFKRMTAAYQVLMNEETRKEYDGTLLSDALPRWGEDSEQEEPDYEPMQFTGNGGMSGSRVSRSFGRPIHEDPSIIRQSFTNLTRPLSTQINLKRGFLLRMRIIGGLRAIFGL